MSSSNLKKRHTFNACERIKSKKLAEELFQKGSSFFLYPFIIKVLAHDNLPREVSLQTIFAVPKKKVRLAVDRNLIRRRVKEAFRQRKANLLDDLAESNTKALLSFVYIAKEPKEYFFIEEKIDEILKEIPNHL